MERYPSKIKCGPEDTYSFSDVHMRQATIFCAFEIGGEALVKQINSYENGESQLPETIYLWLLEDRLPGAIDAILARADVRQTDFTLKSFGEDQPISKDGIKESKSIVLPTHLTEM